MNDAGPAGEAVTQEADKLKPVQDLAAGTLLVNEIFTSIQGEGWHTGLPTIFIRLTACHLRCSWCDTKYSYFEGERMPLAQVAARIRESGMPYVCLTGGEPLLQAKALTRLVTELGPGQAVDVETSGSLRPSLIDVDRSRFEKLRFIWDIKPPASGEAGRNDWQAAEELIDHRDELKAVITSRNDFDWVVNQVREHGLDERFSVTFSPAWGLVEPADLASWVIELAPSMPSAKLQLQVHKFIWGADTRGV